MGRRVYLSAIDTVTIGTAVQDIWSLLAGSAKGIQMRWIQLTASGVTSAAELRLRLKRGTATVTQGSGGTTPAANIVDGGDALAATATVHANDTSQATTSGNFTGFVQYFNWNVLLPFDYQPGPEENDQEVCMPSQAWILDLPAVIVSTVVSGFIRWRELP